MSTWTWKHWQDQPYLTCSLLADWPHGFFTQAFWPAQPETLVAALSPHATVYRTRQVHGKRVLAASEISWVEDVQELPATAGPALATLPTLPEADGCYSHQANQSVWACSADCTPALIADCRTGQVAAVHAGWRGTAQGIVPIAIEQLRSQGSQLADLRVALGPAIAGDVYQVGLDVATEVATSVIDAAQTTRDVIAHLQALENPPILPDPDPDRVRLDVRRINELQLLRLGLSPAQVAIAPHCTYQMPEHFFSYRRTGQRQVQWSGIVSV